MIIRIQPRVTLAEVRVRAARALLRLTRSDIEDIGWLVPLAFWLGAAALACLLVVQIARWPQ